MFSELLLIQFVESGADEISWTCFNAKILAYFVVNKQSEISVKVAYGTDINSLYHLENMFSMINTKRDIMLPTINRANAPTKLSKDKRTSGFFSFLIRLLFCFRVQQGLVSGVNHPSQRKTRPISWSLNVLSSKDYSLCVCNWAAICVREGWENITITKGVIYNSILWHIYWCKCLNAWFIFTSSYFSLFNVLRSWAQHGNERLILYPRLKFSKCGLFFATPQEAGWLTVFASIVNLHSFVCW